MKSNYIFIPKSFDTTRIRTWAIARIVTFATCLKLVSLLNIDAIKRQNNSEKDVGRYVHVSKENDI